jgi:hypothetical protein
MEHCVMKLKGENRSTLGKTCHSATLSTTNPTWTEQGSKPDLRGERPATNRLRHGKAYFRQWVVSNITEVQRISHFHEREIRFCIKEV